MISKSDLHAILDDVNKLEKKMEQTYREAASRCTTEKYRKFFQSMADEECEHSAIVDEIHKLISGLD
jgi:rubrerythrin